MTSHFFPRALTALSLLLVPLAAACFEDDDHTVGTDVDAGSGSGSGASDGSAGCASDNIVCNEPDIPQGCSLGEPKCVNGVYECPGVVCPADSGTCSGSEVCSEPAVPVGCHLGAGTCENGVYVCPPVVCPQDAGAGDAGQCITAPVVTASDLSCQTDDDCTLVLQGSVCKDGCYCPLSVANTTFQQSEQSIVQPYETGGEACGCPAAIPPACKSGTCSNCGGSGQPSCPDAGAGNDARTGTDFACAQTTCDSATQYCVITQGGAIQPDGSVNVNGVCDTIPSTCADDHAGSSAECACLKQQSTGTTCSFTGNEFTVYRDVP